MKLLEIYIISIFIVKLVFIGLVVYNVYLNVDCKAHPTKCKKSKDIQHNVEFYKKRIEFLFTIMMSVLLIYLFNPRSPNYYNQMTNETLLLLFVFGIINILTANWEIFISESVAINYIAKLIT